MSSLLDHGSVRTAAVEQVVAPIACHLCLLVLLSDGAEEPGGFSRLEEAAQALARATENMAAVASRWASETEDPVLSVEMSPLLEPLAASGQHVLLAAQKLHIQPGLAEHKEDLISAAQSVFLGVVKVLLVNDDASIREVVSAADAVSECLSELGSCADITSLLRAFQAFSDALLLLNSLTVERSKSLQDPRQSKQLLDSLETLTRCISMLHTAMSTTIKHPTSEQAQAAKRFILDKVQSTLCDITATLRSEGQTGSPGPCGFYIDRKTRLLELLADPPSSTTLGSTFDSLLRDLVFHCMVVANSSRRESQRSLVLQCRRILQSWSDIKRMIKSQEDPDCLEPLQNSCTIVVQQIQVLDKVVMTSILYQVLDTFLTASTVFEGLVDLTKQVLAADSSTDTDLNSVQPVVEDLISYTDGLIRVANFVAAVAVDAKSLENVENSRVCLARLRANIGPLSLELEDNLIQTLQKLHETCQQWDEETRQLQDALSDVIDVREFTAIAISEMVNNRHGCDSAYREQSYKLFHEHATRLRCHMRLVTHSVRRHLDRSDEPIYRNGLLVLLKQVQLCQAKVERSIRDMLRGSSLSVEGYSTFSDSVSTALQSFKVVREGLDGQQHPHLLSPLREGARQQDVKNTCELNLDRALTSSESPVLEVIEKDLYAEHEVEHSVQETVESEPAHKYDSGDLELPAACNQLKRIHMPFEFDLLPLLYEVVTVTKGRDVTVLNQACTGLLELSNCYAQAVKEALAIVDAVDCKMLEGLRADLVSLTPLLVHTAQETAMSTAMSTESIYKHSTRFSDLINNIRKVLLPVAGTWFHAVYAELRGRRTTADVRQQLNEFTSSCADVVRLLTSSEFSTQRDGQETLSVLHNKLNKAQNNTRCLVEFSASGEGRVDQLEALCMLWGLSVHIVFDSLDKILGRAASMSQLSPQKQLSMLCENSLRLQEAARLTSLNCKSGFKSKQLTELRDELKSLTDAYLQAAEHVGVAVPGVAVPGVMHLVQSELCQKHLLIKIRLLSGHLSKANKNYDTALQNIVSMASSAAETEGLENATQLFFENVKSATKSVESCLNYIRDPRARSNLRSINDHLSFQISDLISRVRLLVETHDGCDTLSLDVQIQCWSAKAHYVVEELCKQEGIHQGATEHIRAGLQGRTPGDIKEVFPVSGVDEAGGPSGATRQKIPVDAMEPNMIKYGPEKDDIGSSAQRDASSLACTSLFLKQESDSWDPEDNRIVQVTRKMADTIYNMTHYLKNKGPLLNKEAFVAAAKDVISHCQSVTHFIRVIANHCLDKQCTVELSLIVEQVLTVTNQLSIISSVNAVTPGYRSSDEILVKNAQNLLQTVLRGVHAAETACITGLRQPEPDSEGAEATALCFQWKRNLEIHRAQQTSNPDTDELGLRKTSSHSVAPSLAPPVHDGYKLPLSLKKSGAEYIF